MRGPFGQDYIKAGLCRIADQYRLFRAIRVFDPFDLVGEFVSQRRRVKIPGFDGSEAPGYREHQCEMY